MNGSVWLNNFRRWLSSSRAGGNAAAPLRKRSRPWLEGLEDRVVPATPLTINVPAGDVTSLINAINQGDAHDGGAIINLQTNANGTAATYNLTQVYISSTGGVNGFWYGPEGLPPITNNIVINGNGDVIQRDPRLGSSTPFRLFFISGGPSLSGQIPAMTAGNLTLNDLTLQDGLEHGGNSGTGGGGLGAGGAIFNMGTLTLNRDTFTNNSAVGGDSGVGTSGGGGGMGADGDTFGDGGGMGGPLVGTTFPNLTPGGGGAVAGGGGGAGFDNLASVGGSQNLGANGDNGGTGGGLTALGFSHGLLNHNGDGGDGGDAQSGDAALGGAGGSFGSGGQAGNFKATNNAMGFGAGGGGGVGGGGGANNGAWITTGTNPTVAAAAAARAAAASAAAAPAAASSSPSMASSSAAAAASAAAARR
jgi:hypothetical protein